MSNAIIGLTWARGAQQSQPPSATISIFSDVLSTNTGYFTGPLPDVVLAPLSHVRVWTYSADTGVKTITVSKVVVTVSPNLPADQASIVQVEPLWLPVAVEPPTGAP